MADQKALKKRLKVLMQRPENQVCSDCPEKKPTWASLIVAPPGAPPGTPNIGAFCCLECSGSHRRLGVHISFVRSVNLDSWKEHEVQAMENGGNFKVNSIFEARLAQAGRQKPTNLADGQTRERFIRDKYERRKFFDPAGYAQPGNTGGPAPSAPAVSAPRSGSRGGSASDVARQRVASRQARMKPSQSQLERTSSQKPKIASAPVSAPVDLLDFAAFESAPEPSPAAPAHDPFASPPVAAPAPSPPPAALTSAIPPAPASAPVPPQPPAAAVAAPDKQAQIPASKPPSSNDSIMALFNNPAPQASFGMQGMASIPQMGMMGQSGMGAIMMNQNSMMVNQNSMMMNQNNMQNNNLSNMQQQSGMLQMGMNPQMMMGMNPQMMAMMQQKQMTMNPQMMAMMQQKQAGVNMMMNNGGTNGSTGMGIDQSGGMGNNYNSMMRGMQQMNIGNQQTMQPMGIIGNQQQSNMGHQQQDDGGFGSPMGGNASTANDPFASLGSMNAFR